MKNYDIASLSMKKNSEIVAHLSVTNTTLNPLEQLLINRLSSLEKNDDSKDAKDLNKILKKKEDKITELKNKLDEIDYNVYDASNFHNALQSLVEEHEKKPENHSDLIKKIDELLTKYKNLDMDA